MNQRIQDHAEHCDFYVGNEHWDKSYEEQQRLWVEKFAQLIAMECIELVERHGSWIGVDYIKEQFGVRE